MNPLDDGRGPFEMLAEVTLDDAIGEPLPLTPMSEWALVEALHEANQARLDRVAAAGYPMNVVGCYLSDLVDFLMFEGRWEHHLAELLDDAEAMIRRATLLGETGRAEAQAAPMNRAQRRQADRGR